MVVAVGPAVIRWQEDLLLQVGSGRLEASGLGAALAFLVGMFVVRQVVRFPHTSGPFYVLPIFLTCFGILFAALLMLRIGFSRYQLLASLFLATVWALAYVYTVARTRRMRIGLAPYGAVDPREWGEAVDVVMLQTPHASDGALDAVVADLRADMPDAWERFLADCALRRLPVYHFKQISESLTGRVHVEHLSENQFGSLLLPRHYEVLKRGLDVLLILVLIPLLVPLMIALALAIRWTSPGPVLFVQERIGFRGESFRMLKFRTMVDSHDGPHYTLPEDQRITSLGKFLRRHRLDELPQIANILRGQMSWIGPRPESAELAKWYEREVPFHRYRYIVRPGITGWAQVNQGQAAGPQEAGEKLQYDFYYIKNFSPWLDLLIALRTVRVLITGWGSH